MLDAVMIPCWTVGTEAARGIALTQGRVRVGEEGRGRRVVDVPVPPGAEIATSGSPKEAPRVLAVPRTESLRDAVAVLLLRDMSGYRGSWRLGEVPQRLVEGQPVPDEPLAPSVLGVLIAEGRCADGIAGAMGGGPEYLLACYPGRFALWRSGRLYGSARVLAVEIGLDGTVTVRNALADLASSAAGAAWGAQ